MPINFRSLQERLRERLLSHIAAGELTGLELARETGFRQAHISNFLNHKRGLSLDAMDKILEVRHLSVLDLLPEPQLLAHRKQRELSDSPGFLTIPLVGEADCAAAQIPKSPPSESLRVTSVLQSLRTEMQIPRAHWDRFIALRVNSADTDAMSPLFPRNSIVVVDRHYHSLRAYRASEPNVYLVRLHREAHVRYVEQIGTQVVARARNPAHPLTVVEPESGRDAISAIIGRICLITTQV